MLLIPLCLLFWSCEQSPVKDDVHIIDCGSHVFGGLDSCHNLHTLWWIFWYDGVRAGARVVLELLCLRLGVSAETKGNPLSHFLQTLGTIFLSLDSKTRTSCWNLGSTGRKMAKLQELSCYNPLYVCSLSDYNIQGVGSDGKQLDVCFLSDYNIQKLCLWRNSFTTIRR